MRIESGYVSWKREEVLPGDSPPPPKGEVSFAAPFASAPTVVLGFAELNLRGSGRMAVGAESVDRERFEWTVEQNDSLYAVTVFWLAYGD